MFVVSLISALVVGVSYAAGNVAYMTTPELVKNLKYPFEKHQVVTQDGYILTHHRIPYGRQGPGNATRPAVIVQHGLVGDSSAWVNHNSKQTDSIGFMLADQGYDVWLFNSRGNFYSRGHAIKNRFDPTFFDFSYHEMGVYDLPDTIDYILGQTGATKLAHIGHSQGTTAMWVMLSEKPEYNSKVSLHIAYAPVAFHTHSRNPVFRFVSYFEKTGMLSMKPFRIWELPRNIVITYFLINVCSNWSPFRYICEVLYYWNMGYNPDELDRTELYNIYGHYPSSSSLKQFTHFSQAVNKPVFAQFDYKRTGNYAFYDQASPPEYNLTKVEIPVYSFYGGSDNFCQLPDVDKLHSKLINLKAKYYIEKWAHYDFLHGINAKRLIYEPTIQILNENL